MKVITNDRLIKRNSRIGQIATVSGLLVLVGGMVIAFRNPNSASISWLALIAGFALSQIGLYFGNRWGRHPRPDELLDQGLKGLSDSRFSVGSSRIMRSSIRWRKKPRAATRARPADLADNPPWRRFWIHEARSLWLRIVNSRS